MGFIMNLLNNLFKHKFCINLDRRSDRWQDVQKEFETYNIKKNTILHMCIGAPMEEFYHDYEKIYKNKF